jgi:Fuc2NAc and GlcNAc transferase
MRRVALRRELLDVPDHRSSHTRVTPRGGGMAIVLSFLSTILLLALFRQIPVSWALAFFGAGGAVAWVGFLDDHGHVPAHTRLAVHAGSALFALACLGGPPAVQFGKLFWPDGGLAWLLWLPFLIWLVNLYNFMDGIDGIAGIEAVTVLIAATVVASSNANPDSILVMQALLASTLGFLVWNWPPARIFMGDAGSGFIGMMLGVLVLASAGQAAVSVWSWLILLGVFLVDATVTLLTRMLFGQRWWEPHRSHAYQNASRRYGGHGPVTVSVAILNLAWLMPMAWCAAVRPEAAWWLTTLALAPLLFLAVWFGAGRPEAVPGAD